MSVARRAGRPAAMDVSIKANHAPDGKVHTQVWKFGAARALELPRRLRGWDGVNLRGP